MIHVDASAGAMPSPRSSSPPAETEIAVSTDSCSEIGATSGADSSIALAIMVSTAISAAPCLLSIVSDDCFLLAAGFLALLLVRLTLDLVFFGITFFAAFLRAGLALA